MTRPDDGATLNEWLTYLESVHHSQIDLGLDRIRDVANTLGLSTDYYVITVGGTNGKGSVCAMLEAMLHAGGYRTGCYTSPHLVTFNERIRVNQALATDEQIIEQLARIEDARGTTISLSYFEFATLAALLLFQQEGVDVALLEVGLGGRLDAVNVVDPDCSVITSIDLDHTDYLGDNREAIGFEKAHIFRPGKPAICADPMPPQTVIEHAEKIGADLWLFGRDFNYSGDQLQWAYAGRSIRRNALGYPALRGANQLLNASAALAVLEAMRPDLSVPTHALRLGLLHAALPGRFQIMPGQPVVILDVAHNPHAAGALGQNLAQMPSTGQTFGVVGLFHDKDIDGVLAHVVDHIDHWYCTQPGGPRALPAPTLAVHVEKARAQATKRREHTHDQAHQSVAATAHPGQGVWTNGHAPSVRPAVRARHATVDGELLTFSDPVEAFEKAQEKATLNDRILVFGSFDTVGPVLEALSRKAS